MEPCDRTIVRFSLACLVLSVIAGLLPIVFAEHLHLPAVPVLTGAAAHLPGTFSHPREK